MPTEKGVDLMAMYICPDANRRKLCLEGCSHRDKHKRFEQCDPLDIRICKGLSCILAPNWDLDLLQEQFEEMYIDQHI